MERHILGMQHVHVNVKRFGHVGTIEYARRNVRRSTSTSIECDVTFLNLQWNRGGPLCNFVMQSLNIHDGATTYSRRPYFKFYSKEARNSCYCFLRLHQQQQQNELLAYIRAAMGLAPPRPCAAQAVRHREAGHAGRIDGYYC